MQLVHDRDSLRRRVDEWKAAGKRIALVPTMGNLHDGHVSLVALARENADRVVASVFVNPTQFGPDEDFERYPRTLKADAERLEGAGCDLLFAPAVEEVYPHGLDRAVMLSAPADLGGILEGRSRPGHFEGVVTVVARLFLLVNPDCAVFGEKDYQQLLVVRRLVEDLGFNTEIIAASTRRESSGLALSSRNAYLSDGQRQASAALYATLQAVANHLATAASEFERLESWATGELESLGFEVDYVAIRRADDLAKPDEKDRNLRILVAAFCGSTRLIDNLAVEL